MKISGLFFRLAVILCGGLILGPGLVSGKTDNPQYHPGRVLILAEPGYSPSVISLLPDVPFTDLKNFQDWKLTSVGETLAAKENRPRTAGFGFLDNLYILSFPDTVDVNKAVERARKGPGIKFAEPDYCLELFSWPADSLFSQQWYLRNIGQPYYAIERVDGDSNDIRYLTTGKPGEDVNLAPIYDNPPADSAPVLVAIIDTGVDYDHPDLAGNIYYNSGEVPGNGLDDDHNGFIDDYIGWDFSGNAMDDFGAAGDNDVSDQSGHGTHLAGLVAAVSNTTGITGYPGRVKILPVKIFPRAFQSVTVPAIIYAVDMGARVLNMSWGSPLEMDILREALVYARERGCLPVAAIGNFASSMPVVPAAFEETFAVGGTNSQGYMTYFSSYGRHLDIVAPGQDILSLRAAGTDLYGDDEPGLRIIADRYIIADGTSMSAPLVAGAAAMLWSFNPTLSAEAIEDALRQSARDLVDPWNDGANLPGYDTLSGWGRLDAGAAYDLLSAPSAYITSPRPAELVSGNVTVGIAVTGNLDGPLRLYLGDGKLPVSWSLLYEGAAADNDQFFIWNSGGFNGYYSLKLESNHGSYQVYIRVAGDAVAEITSPAEGEEISYLAVISGSAFGPGFDSTVISYRPDTATGYERLFASPAFYFDEYMADWPIYRLAGGWYQLRIEAFYDGAILADSVRVYIAQTMRAGFPRQIPGLLAFSPGAADIDGDGRKEIVVGTNNGVYAFNDDGTPLAGYPVEAGLDMRSIPAFDDVDGDGLLDIIMTGTKRLGCYNYLGQSLPGWPREASTGITYYTFPTAVATKLYDSGDSVIIYMSPYGEVRAYRYNGNPYFYSLDGLFTALDPNIFDTLTSTGLSAPVVTATDLEDNGSIDVVAIYGTAIDESGVYIWNGRNGLPPPGWLTPQARNIRRTSGGVLADIDEDGTLEIVVTGQDSSEVNAIWAIEPTRQDVPGWPVYLEAVNDWIGTSPVCLDIDGDSYKEVVVAFFNWDFAHVYAFNHDGTPFRENPPYLPRGLLLTTQNTLGHIVVADIDGNGTLNLIGRAGHLFPYPGCREKIFVWEPDGSPTPGFPIITPTPSDRVYSTPNTPVIDDIDGDGKVDVMLCGDYNEIFVWSLDYQYHADRMPWPKYQGDNNNSGINPNRGEPTAAGDDPVALPVPFALLGNFPNPFNPSTAIRFSLDRAEVVCLEVYNILGQRVITLRNDFLPAGQYRVDWDGTNTAGSPVASGVYLVQLTAGDRYLTHKMMLVR